jgi:hypothetical protein
MAFAAVTWVPLAALAFAEHVATRKWDALVLDPAVHARLLLTVPLLVAAEQAMHAFSERCVERLAQSGLVADGPAGIRRVVSRGEGLRDAVLPEVVLALAAVAVGQAALWGLWRPIGVLASRGPSAPSTLTDLWWGIVSLPVAQFLFYRSLWRWAIWIVVLWGLARLDLRPVALHPDRRGGLSLLAEPSQGFATVVLAVECSIAVGWGWQMIVARLPLKAWAVSFSGVALGSGLVALGPLLAFSRCMWRARYAAIRQYDLFALRYAEGFHRKWIQGGSGESPLGTSDIQSMADLANTLAIVRSMQVVPFGALEIGALLVALGLPLVPLFLVEMPLDQLVRRAAALLVG